METKFVVDVQDAPEEVKTAIFNKYRGKSNDVYVEFNHWGETGGDDDLISSWIENQGIGDCNGVLIKYWW